MKRILLILVVLLTLISCEKVEEKVNPLTGTWKQVTNSDHQTDEIWIFTDDKYAWIGPKLDTLVYNCQYYFTEDRSHIFIYNLDNKLIFEFDIEFTYGKTTIMSMFFEDNKWYIFQKM